MARRDVDVVIGARTDDASFNRAKQRTDGFLSKLRRGGGGGLDDSAALQQTAKAAEIIGKIAQVAVILREGIGAFSASLDIGRGLMAGIAGDAERMDEALLSARDSISKTSIGAAGLVVGDSIFGDQSDAERIRRETAETARRNDATRERTNKARLFAIKITAQIAEAERLAGKEGVRLELERSRIATERQLEELASVRRKTRNHQVSVQLDEAALAIASEQARIEADIAGKMQERIDATVRAGSIEDRLFGLDGSDRAIEAIRLRTEAREEELSKMIDQAVTSEQRLQIEEELARVQERAAREIRAVGSDALVAASRQTGAGLPTLSAGLLTSGAATSAAAGRDFQIEQKRVAAETEENTSETVAVLRELLEESRRRGITPILN